MIGVHPECTFRLSESRAPTLGELVKKGDNSLSFSMKSLKEEIFSYIPDANFAVVNEGMARSIGLVE